MANSGAGRPGKGLNHGEHRGHREEVLTTDVERSEIASRRETRMRRFFAAKRRRQMQKGETAGTSWDFFATDSHRWTQIFGNAKVERRQTQLFASAWASAGTVSTANPRPSS